MQNFRCVNRVTRSDKKLGKQATYRNARSSPTPLHHSCQQAKQHPLSNGNRAHTDFGRHGIGVLSVACGCCLTSPQAGCAPIGYSSGLTSYYKMSKCIVASKLEPSTPRRRCPLRTKDPDFANRFCFPSTCFLLSCNGSLFVLQSPPNWGAKFPVTRACLPGGRARHLPNQLRKHLPLKPCSAEFDLGRRYEEISCRARTWR